MANLGIDEDVLHAFRLGVLKGISLIPYAGGPISTVSEFFWKDPKNVYWNAVKDEVQALCRNLIDQNNVKQLEMRLKGFKENVKEYNEMNMGTKGNKLEYLLSECTEMEPFFYDEDNPTKNFSTFVQWATIRLSLLRDQRFFYKKLAGVEDPNAGLTQKHLEEYETNTPKH
jgi:hypothetical protein